MSVRTTLRYAAAALMAASLCAAQTPSGVSEREIRQKLDAVYAGRADEVKRELSGLLARYPNDPGVNYLQAVLTTDGGLAAKRYGEIADAHPESVWADDALYKVYQYDYSMGLYRKADEVMERLRAKYPRSIYVTGSAEGATPTAVPPVKKGDTKHGR